MDPGRSTIEAIDSLNHLGVNYRASIRYGHRSVVGTRIAAVNVSHFHVSDYASFSMIQIRQISSLKQPQQEADTRTSSLKAKYTPAEILGSCLDHWC